MEKNLKRETASENIRITPTAKRLIISQKTGRETISDIIQRFMPVKKSLFTWKKKGD